MSAPDPVFEAYWKKLVDAWDDDARHKQLLTYASQVGLLDELARRYRSIAIPEGDAVGADPPTDDELARRADAKKRLEGVATAAVLLLTSETRDEPIDGKRLGRRLGLAFLALVMIVLAYSSWLMYASR